MSKRRSCFVATTFAAVLAGMACSDASRPLTTEPYQPDAAASSHLLGGLLGGVTGTLTNLLVAPVNRTTPLPADVVWTFTAGPGGAVSSNSTVGLTISIPSGALASTQTITVRALAGAPVAYAFEPHLVFSKKVYLTQKLNGTTAGLLSVLSGAHFATDRLELNEDGLASVTEIVPGVLSGLFRTFTFGVTHFSGWTVASGRATTTDEE